eukprot:CAMPEP_0168349130 /NCGR_PEP_ID=MMETSP0213-20121227/20212_1 /TAXON_ID=151035 /ORGANISM="Euplotes harpa, Strain FSP1.4" /LENGTH=73 /DNA_ID=CAMNT_0008358971 /DNA_START=125 /DNA_END=346 /DNA_ORIENTATION=-
MEIVLLIASCKKNAHEAAQAAAHQSKQDEHHEGRDDNEQMSDPDPGVDLPSVVALPEELDDAVDVPPDHAEEK